MRVSKLNGWRGGDQTARWIATGVLAVGLAASAAGMSGCGLLEKDGTRPGGTPSQSEAAEADKKCSIAESIDINPELTLTCDDLESFEPGRDYPIEGTRGSTLGYFRLPSINGSKGEFSVEAWLHGEDGEQEAEPTYHVRFGLIERDDAVKYYRRVSLDGAAPGPPLVVEVSRHAYVLATDPTWRCRENSDEFREACVLLSAVTEIAWLGMSGNIDIKMRTSSRDDARGLWGTFRPALDGIGWVAKAEGAYGCINAIASEGARMQSSAVMVRPCANRSLGETNGATVPCPPHETLAECMERAVLTEIDELPPS